jgi:hypothetical protein
VGASNNKSVAAIFHPISTMFNPLADKNLTNESYLIPLAILFSSLADNPLSATYSYFFHQKNMAIKIKVNKMIAVSCYLQLILLER